MSADMAVDASRTEIEPGVELHYRESGAGIPIVFIHGLTGDLGSWGEQVPAFEEDYRTIIYSRRFSRPNHNDLQGSPEHSVLVDAIDLSRLLDRLDAEPAVLIGSSYGAYTALALGMAQPAKVRAMVLCEPPVLSWADLVKEGKALREDFERNTVYPAREAFAQGNDKLAAQLYATGVLGGSGVGGMSSAARARRFANTDAIKALALSKREFIALDPAEAKKLSMPILLMSGQNTRPIFASIFESASRLMPNATALRVPGAGHSVYREQPAVFNQLCRDFLAERLGQPVA